MTKSNKVFKLLTIVLVFVLSLGLIACTNKADEEAALAFDEAVEEIGDVTVDDEVAIAAARTTYDGLTAEQKLLVTKYSDFVAKEATLVVAQDTAKAAEVDTVINAIPTAVNLAHKPSVIAARTKYNALTVEQKLLVTKLTALEQKEAKIAILENVKAVMDMIDALPATMTLEDKVQVQQVKALFDYLPTADRALVTNKNKLDIAEVQIRDLEKDLADAEDIAAAETFDALVLALPAMVQQKDKHDCELVLGFYNDTLTAKQKNLTSQLPNLEAKLARIALLEKADPVSELIKELPEEVVLESETAIVAARTAYDALTADEKALVKKYEVLVEKELDLDMVKNPDLVVLYAIRKALPKQIVNNFELPTAEGTVTWKLKNSEDAKYFDVETGELLRTTYAVANVVLVAKYDDTELEITVNFGLLEEGQTPVYYVGGAAADKPAGGNAWDGHGTYEDQLENAGFGGAKIVVGDKVYFVSKDAYIPIKGTTENQLISRTTLRPHGLEAQTAINNSGMIKGVPTDYKGAGSLYYNEGEVPVTFWLSDTYGRGEAAYAYGKVPFFLNDDGTFTAQAHYPDHTPSNASTGTISKPEEKGLLATLNPGEYLWAPHTWDVDTGAAGFGTRLSVAPGVLTPGTIVEITTYKMVEFYDVEYELNGGTLEEPVVQYDNFHGFTLPIPTKEGHTFVGWYETEDFSDNYVLEVADGTTGNKKFYAKWMENGTSYAITYVLNEGVNDPEAPATYLIENMPVELKDPTRTGYTFMGWFDNEGLTGTPLTELSVYEPGDKTLYAKWRLNDYGLTYELDGGQLVYATKDQLLQGFLHDFYKFVNPSEDLITFMHGVGKTSGYDGTWHSTHKAKIYAGPKPTEVNNSFFASSEAYMEKWLPFFDFFDALVNEQNSTQYFWGGTYVGLLRIKAYFTGTTFTEGRLERYPDNIAYTSGLYTVTYPELTLPTPVKEGFTFLGWFDNAEFTGDAVTAVPAGSTGDKTFYAKWQAAE